MLDYDPLKNLVTYPGISMARFGNNPHGEPLFRIIFAPSRRNLAAMPGEAFQWVPTYSLGNVWVLEKWLDAYAYSKCTRETWDSKMAAMLGPYPSRGEYQHAHTFTCSIDDANIDKLIAWINEGKNRRWNEVHDACIAAYEYQQEESRKKARDLIQNALPAFGSTAFAGAHGKRGSKTVKDLRPARGIGRLKKQDAIGLQGRNTLMSGGARKLKGII